MKPPLRTAAICAAGFLGGLLCFSFSWISTGEVGVKIGAWGRQSSKILGPGPAFTPPFWYRVERYPLEEVIPMYNSGVGNFLNIRCVEGDTAEGHHVNLGIDLRYRFTTETLKSLIDRFHGRFPKGLIEWEFLRVIHPRFASAPVVVFDDMTTAQQFVDQATAAAKEVLEQRGVHVEELSATFHDGRKPEIHLKEPPPASEATP